MSDKILKLSQAQTLYQDLRERVDALPTNEDIPEVPVQDVQVNGVTSLANGVAKLEGGFTTDSNNNIKVYTMTSYGTNLSGGGENTPKALQVVKAPSSAIKTGTDIYRPIVPSTQHESTFYAIAKLAGADMKDIANTTVGIYPDAQKAAIQNMLGITDLISTEESSTATAAHALNSTFMMNGKLHRATAAITIGDAVEVGTNCEVVKVDEVFIKNTDIASNNTFGVIKVDSNYGLKMNNGIIQVSAASSASIKSGKNATQPITASNQNESVFYGLSKVAGVDLANETVTLGTYPDNAKTAIRSMIGAIGNTDYATNSAGGVIKINNDYGLGITEGNLYIYETADSYLKAGTNKNKSVTASKEHVATFYGLAKAAGADEKNSVLPVGQYTDAAKAAIKSMLGITQTITVTVLTQDNVTVTGQIVTVRAVDATGPIFATAAYEGQPVTFAVPSGFAYHVSVSDTLEHHFNPTTASGIITNTDVAITLQYSDFSTIRTAVDIKAALNAGMDLTDLVGEQITCSKGDDTLSWDVVDYDSTNGSIMLLLHDAFGTANMVFEPAQALMWCENGLAAGSYTFADGSTHYYFTTSTALPAGGQLRATDTTYYLYASQASTGTLETGTVSTTEIAGATDLGTCAQGLLNHFSRNRYGSNNIAESAIQWWLNSDEAANVQRPFITKFQRPQSYNVPGFMNGLDQEFIDCLDEVDWKCSTNNVYECPKSLGGLTDGTGRAYTIKAKFCLASEMEIFGSYGGNPDGSTVFDLYNGADADDRKKYRGTAAQYWWLRSPVWNYANNGRHVSSSGSAGYTTASTSCAVVPACQISRDQEAGT